MINEMYTQAKNSNNYLDAYMIIKNLFSKDPKNVEIFTELLNDGLYLAMWDIEYNERKNYLNEVSNALAIFTDAVDLTPDVLLMIREANKRVAETYDAIVLSEKEYKESIKELKVKANNELLEQIALLHEKIRETKSQEEFDLLLADVGASEQQLDKRNFSQNQVNTYDILTKNFSSTVSKKMEELSRNKVYALNQEAVKSYKHVFDMFSSNKNKYTDSESNLKALLTEFMFSYDTRQLFNETLIYYNHVYSMVFNSISEDLKYKVTVWSIEASKKL